MSKKMLINATLSGEERVAIVEDGLLSELDIEVAGSENTKGNIYKAEVVRIEPGLQAAFVNYGAQRHGFLQIGDIHPDLWPKSEDENNKQRPPINEILHRGQQILVQVVKEERGTKGAAVTTELSLAGRYMVLMANSRSRGISRKIEKDSIRKKIKEALRDLDLPAEMGYIIRTAAIDQPPEELKRDFNYLFSIYKSIISKSEQVTAPTLIYQESSLVLRSVRDYFTPDMDEVLIDDKEVFRQTQEFFRTVMPEHVNLVKLHQERRPIFAKFQIEEQIAQLSNNSVDLPSGGSIVLDQTEALVAIDVNSGKVSSEQSIESTACLVNVEAATEIARQLRLRDLGGLIVIDFIDMRQRKNARNVEKTLEQALKQDKARITQGRISTQFGLLEMSRQRIKPNLDAASYKSCPHCGGSGRVRSCESRAISLLRRIQAGTAKGKIEKVVASVALDVGIMTLNQKRLELRELEQQHHIQILIKPQPEFLPDQISIEFIKNSQNHNDSNGEQKALVDLDFSERRRDVDVETNKDAATSSSAAGDQKDKEHSESGQDGAAAGATQAKQQRRSRQPRQRRPRTGKTSTGSTTAAQSGPDPEQQDKSTSTDTVPPSQEAPSSAVNENNAATTQPQPAATAEPQSKAEPEAALKPQHTEALAQSATNGNDAETAEPKEEKKTASRRAPAKRRPAAAKSASTRTRRKTSTDTTTDAAPSAATADGAEQNGPEAATQTEAPSANSAKQPRQAASKRTQKPKTSGAKPARSKKAPSADQGESNTSVATESAPPSDAGAEKPATGKKRTTRSTAGKKSTSENKSTNASEGSANTSAASTQNSVKGKAEAKPTEEKKPAPRKRTTSGRTNKKTTDEAPAKAASSSNAGTGAKTEAAETSEQAKAGSEAEKAAPKKRTTATRSRSKDVKDSTADTSSTASSSTAAPKTPVRKRTPKKTESAGSDTSTPPAKPSDSAGKTSESADIQKPLAATKDDTAAQQEESSAAKPRTRRTRAKAGNAESDSASETTKPQRRKTSSTSSKKTTAANKQEAPKDTVVGANTEAAEEKPKAKRSSTRRTGTSRRTTATSKKTAATATPAATDEEKPKRRRRSTARKTSASTTED